VPKPPSHPIVTQQASPLLTKFQNDVRLNQALFERIKTIYENQKQEKLSVEQQTLLEKEYKGFARNGALLGEAEKNRLREIDTEKAQLGLTFGEMFWPTPRLLNFISPKKKS
jgi:Zn-dependent oligopeptidase